MRIITAKVSIQLEFSITRDRKPKTDLNPKGNQLAKVTEKCSAWKNGLKEAWVGLSVSLPGHVQPPSVLAFPKQWLMATLGLHARLKHMEHAFPLEDPGKV